MGLNLDRLMAAPGNAGYEVDLALFSAYKISQIYLFQKMIYGPFLGGSRAATARGGSPGPRAQRVRLIRVRARPSRNVWAPGVALPKEERDLIVLPRFAAIRSPPARANDPIGSPARFSRARAKAGKQVRPTVCRAVGARLCFGFV